MDKPTTKLRAIVTGATGMVGAHLVAELLNSNFQEVICLTRKNSDYSNLYFVLSLYGLDGKHPGLTIEQTDFTSPQRLADAMRGCEVVFHCAARVSLSARPDEMVQENCGLTRAVGEAALLAGAGKMVHVSSIAAVRCDKDLRVPADETGIFDSSAGKSAYSASKIESEKEVEKLHRRGLFTITVNPGVILGESISGAGSSPIAGLLAGGVPFYPTGRNGFVDVRDVARAMVGLAAEFSRSGERFVLVGSNPYYRNLLNLGAQAAGKRRPFLKLPASMALAVSWLNDFCSRITGRPLPFSRQVARSLYNNCVYCGDKIKETIKFEYSPIELTISRIVKNHHKPDSLK